MMTMASRFHSLAAIAASCHAIALQVERARDHLAAATNPRDPDPARRQLAERREEARAQIVHAAMGPHGLSVEAIHQLDLGGRDLIARYKLEPIDRRVRAPTLLADLLAPS